MNNYHKRYNVLSELFPNQFNTIPRIIIWLLVLIADIVLVFWAAHLIGLPILAATNKAVLMLYLAAAFALFCLESYLYNLIKH